MSLGKDRAKEAASFVPGIREEPIFYLQVGASDPDVQLFCDLCTILNFFILPHEGARKCTEVHIGAKSR